MLNLIEKKLTFLKEQKPLFKGLIFLNNLLIKVLIFQYEVDEN